MDKRMAWPTDGGIYHKCRHPNIKNRKPKDFMARFNKIMNAVDCAKGP